MEKKGKTTFLEKFIGVIEKLGNKLPHPFWLFLLLCSITLILSFILNKCGVAVEYLTPKDGKMVMTKVSVVNLLSYAEMRPFIAGLVKNYISFPPLGLVLVMMMGVGLIEQTGFLSSIIRKLILKAPSYIVTAVLIFIGINSSVASDAGILFTPTIGAAIFKALGRNPWLGIVAGYAAASGGLSASLFISGNDVVVSGITESVAKSLNIPMTITPVINWYFMSTVTFILTVALTIVTEKFLVKLVDENVELENTQEEKYDLSKEEEKGLKYSLIALIIWIIILSILIFPEKAFFKNEVGGFLPKSPLMSSIVPVIFSTFFITGSAYGVGAGVIKKLHDIPKFMQKELVGMTSIFVTMFPASMFVYLFGKSKLATILAVKGADFIKTLDIGQIPLLVILIFMCTCLNLFIGSSSAKWLILAPVFIPMFTMVGFSPALTQVAYRIGDGATNIISPIAGAVPVILGLLEQYKPKNYDKPIGVGTMISLELPFTITLLVIQTIVLIGWFILNIPLGPGAGVFI
ncbi:AbgT family transporter [Fusobacterium perfoetens]|uniref:AbgT family transporter n=1 Tax=Fusobacterium perfoetens TaxID=852 RepID=UPI0004844B37|nr:AbgT family transporter [Fusobacterium perfoetens]MCI6152883.1 AbgT family transporter [Fusobacterium perfoetens]MDY3237295.1 AbgT family transporter [Fusobacterium perfoetens]